MQRNGNLCRAFDHRRKGKVSPARNRDLISVPPPARKRCVSAQRRGAPRHSRSAGDGEVLDAARHLLAGLGELEKLFVDGGIVQLSPLGPVQLEFAPSGKG
jgi:hypothetical protein